MATKQYDKVQRALPIPGWTYSYLSPSSKRYIIFKVFAILYEDGKATKIWLRSGNAKVVDDIKYLTFTQWATINPIRVSYGL